MGRYRPEVMVSLVLVVLTWAAFWQVCGNDFVNYDDGEYLTQNPHVQAGLTPESVRWAFTTTHCANWHPLTWLSLQLDHQLYGLASWGYHLTNLLLHTANVLLLFVALRRMTGAVWRSAVVAALFAVHPLHVESVAWVSERKDVLSTFFGMLTLGAYIGYAQRPGPARYLLVVLAFALSLLAKPMLVTLPFVLLLLDYWPLGRFGAGRRPAPGFLRSLVVEKLPLFALAAASCAVTVFAQQKAVLPLEKLPLEARIANALVAYVHYLRLTVWPRNLAVFYPHAAEPGLAWEAVAAGGLLVCLSAGFFWAARRPYLIVGWLWYLGTLVPVLGLVQVGLQAAADRYTYVPLIGLFVLLVWGVSDLLAGLRWHRAALKSASAALLLACLVLTRWQVGYWKNSVTLWEHALEVTPENFTAHYNLGLAFALRGNLHEAFRHFSVARRLNPEHAEPLSNMGVILTRQGKLSEASRHFAAAVKIKPEDALLRFNLGCALAQQGQLEGAVEQLRQAVNLRPDVIPFLTTLEAAYAKLGRYAEAETTARAALRLAAAAQPDLVRQLQQRLHQYESHTRPPADSRGHYP
jgi:tetratricopeptide (TPR) repeat protein